MRRSESLEGKAMGRVHWMATSSCIPQLGFIILHITFKPIVPHDHTCVTQSLEIEKGT
jgi:hypothetical protein